VAETGVVVDEQKAQRYLLMGKTDG